MAMMCRWIFRLQSTAIMLSMLKGVKMKTLSKFLILACFATMLYWEPAVADDSADVARGWDAVGK